MEGSSFTQQLDWVARHSPLTRLALSRFPASPPSESPELFIAFHIDLKMIPVILGLAERVVLKVIACNKSTVDPAGWSHLAERRVELLEYGQAFAQLDQPASRPRYLCDLGGELICYCLQRPGSAVAAMEGTTSGLLAIERQLRGQRPGLPILDWNSAPLKLAVHNEKMVGFSLWQTFSELTRLSLHGKAVGVLGFGAVGRGIARTARHLGGTVSVFDPQPSARTLAAFEGFATPGREAVLAGSDVLVTATGRAGALRGEDLEQLRDGAFLLNAGHGSQELAADLREHPGRHTVLRHIEEIRFGPALSRHCFLLARGELVNLSAGFGDTINGFDLTSAQLVEATGFLLREGAALQPGWHTMPGGFMDELLSEVG
jgi:adenosylhomocysteinase